MMLKKLLRKSTAMTLVLTLMSSTLSCSLSGCDFSDSKINTAKVYTRTYADTALEETGKSLTKLIVNLTVR